MIGLSIKYGFRRVYEKCYLLHTGSRPQSLPWGFDETDSRCVGFKEKLELELVKIIDRGYTHFIGGMALGVDQYAFDILLEYKKRNPDRPIFLEAAIPCETQAVKWKETQRDRYFYIMQNVDKETLVSRKYYPYCMQKRNEYMVDNSSLVLAAMSNGSKGTAGTVKYAQSKGLEIIKILI